MLDKLAESPRPALALLSRCCKRDAARSRVAASWQDIADILAGDDAKARKNAAVLLGALGERRAAGALVQALRAEQQMFVRPSIILALGALGGREAREAVAALPVPSGEDKHSRAEAEAIAKALSRLAPEVSRVFTGFATEQDVVLAPVPGLYKSLADEAGQLGIKLRSRGKLAATKTADYPGLFRMRSFNTAMLPLADGIDYSPAAAAAAMAGVYGRLSAIHEGSGPFAARLELRNPPRGTDRAAFASGFFSLLGEGEFRNSPSSYDVELRLLGNGAKADAYLLLHTYEDSRFAYRVGSVPASINPAAAAAALRMARGRMREGARVLDPFCGSGTMLIERDKLLACSALHGVDRDKSACAVARANAKAAGVDMPVYNRDCIGFQAEEGYDEVVANMPFGNRVGSHSDNERLYAAFMRQLPGLLRQDGYMLAITNEKALLRRCVGRQPGLRIEKETAFSYGGLSPSAFLVVLDK